MTATRNTDDQPSRRAILQKGLACSLIPPATHLFAAQTEADTANRTLVLLHLSGGNDGLNTVVPYADPIYREMRPRLGRIARDVIDIDGRVGFHPALTGLARLFDAGQLAVLQGVGYQEPDYSHVGSCAVWAAGGEPGSAGGWCDRVFEQQRVRSRGPAVCVGGGPLAAMVRPDLIRLAGDAGQPGSPPQPLDYVAGAIERTLATAARIASLPQPAPVVFATVGGFDTHADQLTRHASMLAELGDALESFHGELVRRNRGGQVLLIAWSEFGRRLAENAHGGTDHGSAGLVLLVGGTVRGGLHGPAPSLEMTHFGNLIPTVDLRTVWHLAADWLGQCS
jgi:uncharacterized protein (DUF1501 family)